MIVSIFALTVVLPFLVYGIRNNYYLAFLVFIFSAPVVVSLSDLLPFSIWEKYSIASAHLLTLLSLVFWFLLVQSKLGVQLREILAESSQRRRYQECFLLFLLLAPFYITMIPSILEAPWWEHYQFRRAFNSENSSLLRFIKFTPVLIALIIFASAETPSKRMFFLAIVVAVFFAFASGAKSNFLLFIAVICFWFSLKNKRLSDARGFLILSSILGASIVFFFMLSIAGDEGIGTAFLERFTSDLGGYVAVLNAESESPCKNYDFFTPLYLFLGNLTGNSVDHLFHSSMGNCLVSPYDAAYDFELLVPIFWEGYLVGGTTLGVLMIILATSLLFGLISIIDKLGKLFDVRYTSFGINLYIAITGFSVFTGGKLGNFITSVFFTCAAVLVFVGLLIQIVPRKKPRFIESEQKQAFV